MTDDNGGFTEKSFSRYIPELEQPIKGNFFLCGLGEENFTELPENLIRKYTERFWGPEAFVSMFGQMSIIRMVTEQSQNKKNSSLGNPGGFGLS